VRKTIPEGGRRNPDPHRPRKKARFSQLGRNMSASPAGPKQQTTRALKRRILELDDELQAESRRLVVATLERDELYAAVLAEQEHRA